MWNRDLKSLYLWHYLQKNIHLFCCGIWIYLQFIEQPCLPFITKCKRHKPPEGLLQNGEGRENTRTLLQEHCWQGRCEKLSLSELLSHSVLPKIYGTSYVNVPFLEALWWKTSQQKISESLADLSAVSYMAQRHTGLTQARNCVSCHPLASWERQGWNLEAKCQFNFPTRAYFSLKKARAENHWDQGCALGAQRPVHTLPASFKTGHPLFFFILQY